MKPGCFLLWELNQMHKDSVSMRVKSVQTNVYVPSPDGRDTSKSVTASWRATTRQWPAPNPSSPHPFQSPARPLDLLLLAPSPSPLKSPTTARTTKTSGKRQIRRKSLHHTMSTSFPSRTPSPRKCSPTCHQRALQGTEEMLRLPERCRSLTRAVSSPSHTHTSRCADTIAVL